MRLVQTSARLCAAIIASLLAASSALAGVVNSTANSGAGSLRDTLAAAASGDTITFSLTLLAMLLVIFARRRWSA